jgi:hypothetical protein
LEKISTKWDTAKRMTAGTNVVSDLDRWARATRLQADRLCSHGDGDDQVSIWADSELFMFAVAGVRRGLAAVATICDPITDYPIIDGAPFAGLLHNFDVAVPTAKNLSLRIAAFDQWGYEAGSQVILAHSDSGVFVEHVGKNLKIDIEAAATAADQGARAAAQEFERLRAELQRLQAELERSRAELS